MKKYFIGLFLILLIAGCQQQAETPPTPGDSDTEQALEPGATETDYEMPEAETPEPEPAEAAGSVSGADVSILGKEGFDPEELTVSEGAIVVFMNNGDKLVTLNVWEGRRVADTVIVKAGERGEVTFNEAGSFEVRALEYGTSIPVAVE